MNLLTAALLGLAVAEPNKVNSEGLKFVFEINRHGARGPMALPGDPSFGEGFKFGTDNLTPSGMRMRSVLGHISRQRYIEGDNPFLNPETLHKDLYVESTDVWRTIQSVKSELTGMFPPGSDGHPKLDKGEVQSLQQGKGRPNFGIRNFIQISNEVNPAALPQGFHPFAVFNHGAKTVAKNIDYAGCAYLQDSYEFYVSNPKTFAAENTIFDSKMMEPIQKALDFTDEDISNMRDFLAQFLHTPEKKTDTLNFLIIYYLADAIVARQFEGLPLDFDFDIIQQFLVDNAQKWPVIRVFDAVSRKLFMSRIFRTPMDSMEEIINSILAGEEPSTQKYVLFSAHDTQIGNVLEWFQPDNYRMNDIPFASALFMELYHDPLCTQNDESCFYVRTLYNGKPLSINACLDERSFDGSTCNYVSLRSHLDEVITQGDLDKACDLPFVPVRID